MRGQHFEFCESEKAFAEFFRLKSKDNAVRFVVSTHPYTSGYWIEKGSVDDETTTVYETVVGVKNLQRRVRRYSAGRSSRSRVGGVVL